MNPIIIAIDGPSGVGKSTVAAMLAERLGVPYLDTGAMFRTLALRLGEDAARLSEKELRALPIKFDLEGLGADARLLVNGEPVGPEIRTETVGALASDIAKRPEIRALLLAAQRDLGSRSSLVAEGRDMGSVVFPNATRKFFLDARPEIRARRRWLDLRARGENVSLAEVEDLVRKRDFQDRNRAVAPLRPAPDAIIIDTSDLSVDQVLDALAREAGAKDGSREGWKSE